MARRHEVKASCRTLICCLLVSLLWKLVWTSDTEDLYGLLGVPRTATTKEIKKAYRLKARSTHPDKNKGVPPEEAAEVFRKVVHAFEILSDESTRRHYDRTGRAPDSTSNVGTTGSNWQRQSQQYSNFQWNFRRKPMRLKDQFRVQEAQSRVLHIVSLEQLQTVMLDDDDLLERNLLMCMVTPGAIETHADDEMVFPFPFAAMSSQGIWWEDLLQTVKIRFHKGNDLTRFFGLPTGDELRASGQPIFLFGKKGEPLSVNLERLQTSNREAFEKWVWSMVEVRVEFRNEHDHPVEVYWIHGNRAHIKMTLDPGQTEWHTSMLTHEWYIRDTRVDAFRGSPGRHKLSNESSLWRGKIGMSDGPPFRDDGTILVRIGLEKCYDLSGHCTYWERRGECGKNPGFMTSNCALSCKVCSPAETSRGMDDEL